VKLGIRSKLFLMIVGLMLISSLVANTFLSRLLDEDLTARIRDDLLVRLSFLEREASAFEAGFEERMKWKSLADELSHRGGGRITLLLKEGKVLGDSGIEAGDIAHLENHADRLEVQQAFSNGHGSDIRWSSTLKQRMIYVAIPFQREGAVVGVVRFAKPLSEVEAALLSLRKSILSAAGIALLVSVLLTFLLSFWMSKNVRRLIVSARKMALGNLAERTHIEGRDELAELGRVLNQLASELQSALGALRKERDLMNRVLEGMQEGVLLLGKDGHVVFANAALRHLFQLSVDVTGKTQLELIRNATLKRMIDEAKFSMGPVSAELSIASRRLLVHASAFQGEPQGMLAVFVDVTNLRRLETLRRDFVANVSHELRTPIAAVRSAAETLRRTMEVQPELADEFVGIIERNTERLHQLVEDLLDLSHIESREFHLTLEEVDLKDSISQALRMFQKQADARKLRFSTSIPEGTPLVCADKRRLEQVLSNLLDNAIKYGAENTLIHIEVEPFNEFVRVAVRDSGQGIEAKHFSRLFERFYRVDAGRSREVGGTGLGLSIVKHLVEAMHGWVLVESTLGKGSTFYFTLPTA